MSEIDDTHGQARRPGGIVWLNQKADKAAEEVFEYEAMENEERLEFHIARAHRHILAARDLTYGTDIINQVYNGRMLNRTLNKINNLLFHVASKNRKRLLRIADGVTRDRRM